VIEVQEIDQEKVAAPLSHPNLAAKSGHHSYSPPGDKKEKGGKMAGSPQK